MKNKRLKNINYESEDSKEVKKLIFIIIGITIIAVGLYFLTARSLNKQNKTEFDYNVCTVGMMFNRPYNEYYVFLYSSDDLDATTYKNLVTNYSKKETAKKIYTVDLKSNLDNVYLNEISNHTPSNPNEVRIKDSALVLIKDGKVSNYYESLKEYQEVLQ